MTKKEYMNALAERLRLYPADFQQEILEAFEGHFKEGESSGESEEEIIESLGSVDEVMDNIRMMHIGGSSRGDSFDDLQASFSSLSSSLRDTMRSVSSIVSSSVNTAMREINRAAEDSEESEGFMETGGGSTLKITGHTGALDLYLENGTRLDYHFRPTRSFLLPGEAKLNISEQGDTVVFSSDGSGDLHITVPEEIRTIEIALNSGDVEIDSLETERIYGKTISGDWDIDGSRIENLMISTKSGDIDIDDTVSMNIELSTMSGDMNLRNTEGNIVLSSASGEIDLDGHRGPLVKAETASGDIDAHLVSTEIDLRSVSGEIELYDEGRIEAVSISTVSGDILLDLEDTDYTAQLYSLSGSLANLTRLPEARRSKREWIVGDGLAPVNLKSTSGDIRIQ